ncbi:MAG TPA: MMPL family transporter, partial [Beijerinckiaceae bacterium]|nr:MMPL family transporter [Beijerinckiaceae bacterium]
MQRKTTGIASRAARWSAKHRKAAILGWIVFVIAAMAFGNVTGTNTLADEDMGNGDSRTGEQIIAGAGFPEDASEKVLIQAENGSKSSDPEFTAAVRDVQQRLAAVPHVAEIESPLQAGNESLYSADERSALITFELRGNDDQLEERVEGTLDAVAAAQRAHPGLYIEQFGDASIEKAASESIEKDFQRAETLSLPITLAILVIAFGSLIAAGIPLLLAITAVAGTLGLIGPISQVFAVDEAAASVILLIGLAVGVDYSLFYLRRARAERRKGHSNEDALEIAAATSGRAVLVSGITVMIAMAGMFLTQNATFVSFAIGTIVVVAVAMIGSLTVLPAVLSKLGDRVEKGRIPFLGRRQQRGTGESRIWSAVLDRVLRRPLVSAIAAGGLLVALAIPALHMETKNAGADGLPQDLAVVETFDRTLEAFPGQPMPAVVVIQADDVNDPALVSAMEDMRAEAVATGEMNNPVTFSSNPDGTVGIMNIPMVGNGTDETSIAALETLREDVIPATVGKVAGAEVYVTGPTAGMEDFNEQMGRTAPLVFAFVLGLAFILLMATFRSIVIALKAIVLNLLSVGAAYGVLVWVFQDGHLESLLGFESNGGITSWLPLFMFVLLFGLSMDYHVFILSRVREAFDSGMSTGDAVSHGIKSTAGVVTSAAAVMVITFAMFATGDSQSMKQL